MSRLLWGMGLLVTLALQGVALLAVGRATPPPCAGDVDTVPLLAAVRKPLVFGPPSLPAGPKEAPRRAQAAQEAPERKAEGEEEKAHGEGIRDASWIKAQDPRAYTLQLLGARRLETLRRFASEGGLEGDIAYFQRAYRGRPWYALIQGVYPSLEAAKARAKEARERLKVRPWIRRFGDIQRQLR